MAIKQFKESDDDEQVRCKSLDARNLNWRVGVADRRDAALSYAWLLVGIWGPWE